MRYSIAATLALASAALLANAAPQSLKSLESLEGSRFRSGALDRKHDAAPAGSKLLETRQTGPPDVDPRNSGQVQYRDVVGQDRRSPQESSPGVVADASIEKVHLRDDFDLGQGRKKDPKQPEKPKGQVVETHNEKRAPLDPYGKHVMGKPHLAERDYLSEVVHHTDIEFPRAEIVAHRSPIASEPAGVATPTRRDLTDPWAKYFGTLNGTAVTGHCKNLPYNDKSHGACVAPCHWKKKRNGHHRRQQAPAAGGQHDHGAVAQSNVTAPSNATPPANVTTSTTSSFLPSAPTPSSTHTNAENSDDDYLDLCNRPIYAYRGTHAPSHPPKHLSHLRVVDMCDGIGHEGLRVTLDGFRELGGKMEEGWVRDVNWKFV